MIQNLKVDIIYHSTPSDFEMEFNLCGCCRMRLLSDKTEDKKGFIKALARDVDRSRVIICCGPLFGDECIINTIATAIGNGLDLCNNTLYGIKSNDEIKIVRGSTPLVTPDGYFGGCIIESGPQTIIMLTENKAFRKAIMQNLIHPYIEEICYIPTSAPVAAPNTEPVYETAVTENEEYIVADDKTKEAAPPIEEVAPIENEFILEPDDVQETAEDEENKLPVEEHNIEFVMDEEVQTAEEQTDVALPQSETEAEDSVNFVLEEQIEEAKEEPEAEETPVDESYSLMYTEVETKEEIKARYEDPYKPSESDNMFLTTNVDDDYDNIDNAKRKHSNPKSMNITIVILVLLLLLAVLAIAYFIILEPMANGVSISEHAKQIFGLSAQNTSV